MISLPIFFKSVIGVVVAKPVHKMHIGLLFVRKRHIRSLTAHLTTARPDCAVCYRTYCRRCYYYKSTPTLGNISHASTAAHSATAAIQNHAYDISGSEFYLELYPAILGHLYYLLWRTNCLCAYSIIRSILDIISEFISFSMLIIFYVQVIQVFHVKFTIIFHITPFQIYMLRSSGTSVTDIGLIKENILSVAILVLYIFYNFTTIWPAYNYFQDQLRYCTSLQNPKVSDFSAVPNFALSPHHYYRLQGINP
jgi:hypothetical protein